MFNEGILCRTLVQSSVVPNENQEPKDLVSLFYHLDFSLWSSKGMPWIEVTERE